MKQKRWSRRLGLIGISGILGVPLVLGLTLILTPQLLVNTWTVTQALRWVSGPQSELMWNRLQVNTVSESWAEKQISLVADGFCVRNQQLQVCLETLALAGTIDIRPWQWPLPRLGPIRLLGVDGEWRQPAQQPKPNTAESKQIVDPLVLVKKLEKIAVAEVELGINELILFEADQVLAKVRGDLHLSGLNRNAEDTLTVNLRGAWQNQKLRLDSRLAVEEYQSLLDEQARFTLAADGQFGANQGELNLKLTPAQGGEPGRQLQLTAGFQNAELTLSSTISGRIAQRSFTGDLQVEARQIMNNMVDFDLQPCSLTGSWGATLRQEARLKLQCRGQGRRRRSGHENVVAVFLPAYLNFDLISEGRVRQDGDGLSYSLKNNLTLDHVKNAALNLSGKMRADLDKTVDEPQPQVSVELDFSARVDRFQQLVKQLEDTAFAIPAPVNQLNGTVSCHVDGQYKSEGRRDIFPIQCQTDLQSSKQALKLAGQGRFMFNHESQAMRFHLAAAVNVERLEVVLPDFKLGSEVPKVTADKRFVMEPAPRDKSKVFTTKKLDVNAAIKETPGLFSYDIELTTDDHRAILLHTNLLSKALPLGANLTIRSAEGVSGKIMIQDYKVELFKRVTNVEELTVQLKPNQAQMPLSGRIVFQNNDYTITMHVYGQVQSPQFYMESEPPLPEKDLYAILLFGKQPDALTSDKVRTVDETRSAIADGAINLLSMYYLASTPIESVGYNPAEGMFTAKVNLQEGLSLTLGTDTESMNEVVLRKRLGNNWSIETKAVQTDDDESNRGVAMLRWGRRY
jgi:hypothetical protein